MWIPESLALQWIMNKLRAPGYDAALAKAKEILYKMVTEGRVKRAEGAPIKGKSNTTIIPVFYSRAEMTAYANEGVATIETAPKPIGPQPQVTDATIRPQNAIVVTGIVKGNQPERSDPIPMPSPVRRRS
jgi:type II secretory pathway component PulC